MKGNVHDNEDIVCIISCDNLDIMTFILRPMHPVNFYMSRAQKGAWPPQDARWKEKETRAKGGGRMPTYYRWEIRLSVMYVRHKHDSNIFPSGPSFTFLCPGSLIFSSERKDERPWERGCVTCPLHSISIHLFWSERFTKMKNKQTNKKKTGSWSNDTII